MMKFRKASRRARARGFIAIAATGMIAVPLSAAAAAMPLTETGSTLHYPLFRIWAAE